MTLTKRQKIINSGLLILTALIWGLAFVSQSISAGVVGPLTYNGLRFILGAVVLVPVIVFMDYKKKPNDPSRGFNFKENKALLQGGIICGIILALASHTQQIGMEFTSAGKAGFLTSIYIILVPIFGLLFSKKVGRNIWLSVMISLFGMYLLCITDGFVIQVSDIYVFMGGVLFAFHILAIDNYANRVDGVKMSFIQFLVGGIFCFILALIFEKIDYNAIKSVGGALLYSGIMSCGMGYTLQVVAQKGMNPTIVALLLSLESIFALFADMIILNNIMSVKELAGSALVFMAIILAQMPNNEDKLAKKRLIE